MRRFTRFPLFLLVALAALAFGGCSACDEGPAPQFAAPCVAPQYAAPCAVAASPCAPQFAAPMAQPVGVRFTTGPMEVGRAALNIPPNIAICLVNGIRCAVDALFPVPTPTARYVYASPAPQFAAPMAAPCAPVAPAGTWQFVPAPAAPAAAPCK